MPMQAVLDRLEDADALIREEANLSVGVPRSDKLIHRPLRSFFLWFIFRILIIR